MSHHHGPPPSHPPHMPQRFLMQPSPGFPPRGPPMMPGGPPPPGPLPPHSSPYLPVSMAQAMAAAYNPVVTGSGGYPPPPHQHQHQHQHHQQHQHQHQLQHQHQQAPYPFAPRQPSLGMPMPPATGPQPPHGFYPGPHNPFIPPHMAAVAAAAAAGQPTSELPHPAALFQGLVPPPHALHNSQSTSHTPPQPSSTPPLAQSTAKPPEVPYFNLPAGLIVPLVKPDDCDYKPLDPKLVKLPPPVPPSDRLIKAVELFYAPPSHERPRNADGWEKLALYEFYKSKTSSTKGRAGCHANEKGSLVLGVSNKENDSDENKEDKSNLKKNYDENNSTSGKESSHRRYKEDKSPSRSKEHNRKRHSRSHSHGRSRSRTPERRRRRSRSRHRKSSSSSSRSYSSCSSSRSRSPSPSPKHSRKPKHHRRSPSKSSSPESFRPSLGLGSNVRDKNTKLEESNKGHQLLKKMGWSGTGGLGNKEQGISEPIPTGEVRDASNAYKGIGADSSTQDMYELYRKSRGKEFLDRIQKSKSSH